MSFNIAGNVVITNNRTVNNVSGASGSRPGSPSTGQLFFNTTSGELEVWNGSAWKGRGSYSEPAIPQGWGWGTQRYASLGLGVGSFGTISSPIQVMLGFDDWVALSPGYQNGAGIRADGTMWTVGASFLGGAVLGIGSNTASRSSPASVVGGITDWVSTVASRNRFGLRANGELYAWGPQGAWLGLGDASTASSPTLVAGGLTDWTQVAAGVESALGLRANGLAYSWGTSYRGEGGRNNNATASSPTLLAGGYTDWVFVACGVQQTNYAIRESGAIFSWGSNESQILGQGDDASTSRSSPRQMTNGSSGWSSVVGGRQHSAGTRMNGDINCWGLNSRGQLGLNTTYQAGIPVNIVSGFQDWVQVTITNSNYGTTFGLRANGQLWGWGANYEGSLGQAFGTNFSSPISIVGGVSDWVQITSGGGRQFVIRNSPNRWNQGVPKSRVISR